MAMDKRKKAATESLSFLAVGAAALIALNVLGVFVFARADLTERRLFSLSEGSKRVVRQLEDTLHVTAYFTEDLPPPFNATERYVRDLLAEYEAAADGNVEVRFINPDSDEARQAAEEDGVQRVAHQKIENDSVQVVEGYRGVVFEYLGERKTLPAIETTEGLEYEITQAIKQLAGDKLKVGVLTGHEGPTLQEGLTALEEFVPTYELVEVDATQAIDDELRALLIIDPKTALSDEELRNIDAYVMGGGSLGVFGGAYDIGQEQGQPLTAKAVDTGLNKLLEPWGVALGDGIVADAQCAQVAMRSSLGFPLPVPHPPVPLATFDEEQSSHPVTFRLPQVHLPFTAPVRLTEGDAGDEGVRREVLSRTSERSWLLTGESIGLEPRRPQEWSMDEPRGPFPLMVAVEGKLESAFAAPAMSGAEEQAGPKGATVASQDVHVLVMGGSGFMRDEYLPAADREGRRQMNSSLALALNAVDWLAQEDELIAIRAKSVEDPQIEVPRNVAEAETQARAAANAGDEEGAVEALEARKEALSQWDTRKLRYRMLNTFGMPALLALYGVIRWQNRKRRKAEATV